MDLVEISFLDSIFISSGLVINFSLYLILDYQDSFCCISPYIMGTSLVFQELTDKPVLDTHSSFQIPLEDIGLSLVQRIKLRLFGFVYVGDRMEKGWSNTLPYYAFRCNNHGIQYGYPVGFAKSLFDSGVYFCPRQVGPPTSFNSMLHARTII